MITLPQQTIISFLEDAFQAYIPIIKETTRFFIGMSEYLLRERADRSKDYLFIWCESGKREVYGSDVKRRFINDELILTNITYYREYLYIRCESFNEDFVIEANRVIFHALTSSIFNQQLIDAGYTVAKTTQEAGDTIIDKEGQALIFRSITTLPILYTTSQEESIEYFDNFAVNITHEQ